MIILEGPDNAGKSTLLKQLLSLDPTLRILHREKFRPEKGDTIGRSYLRALQPPDGDRVQHGNSVADRFYASECIYGELFRGGCRMSEMEHLVLRAYLHSYGTLVVFCDPGNEKLLESWAERDQMYQDPMTITDAYRARLPIIFRDFAPVIRYDYTEAALTQTMRIISRHKQMMAYRRQLLSRWSAMPYGYGQIKSPRVVFVSDLFEPSSLHSRGSETFAWAFNRAEVAIEHPLLRHSYFTGLVKGANSYVLLREELRALDLQPKSVIVTIGNEASNLVASLQPTLREFVRIAEIPDVRYWRDKPAREHKHEFTGSLLRALDPSFHILQGTLDI